MVLVPDARVCNFCKSKPKLEMRHAESQARVTCFSDAYGGIPATKLSYRCPQCHAYFHPGYRLVAPAESASTSTAKLECYYGNPDGVIRRWFPGTSLTYYDTRLLCRLTSSFLNNAVSMHGEEDFYGDLFLGLEANEDKTGGRGQYRCAVERKMLFKTWLRFELLDFLKEQ